VGSIPDYIIIFELRNPSNRTTALGSTQPLTEMSTRLLPRNKVWPVRKADSVTAIYELIFQKLWEPRRLIILCASTACYRDSFTFLLVVVILVTASVV
jgi:hypothetical protein